MKHKGLGVILLSAFVILDALLLEPGCARKASSPAQEELITVTDLAGRRVELRQNPQRVVVLYSQIHIAMRCLNISLDRIIGKMLSR